MNMYKGPMDKAKGGRFESGRQGWVGQRVWWSENGGDCSLTTIREREGEREKTLSLILNML